MAVSALVGRRVLSSGTSALTMMLLFAPAAAHAQAEAVSPQPAVQQPPSAVSGPATPTLPASENAADIVVTAQRRNEALQNVPIAVSAFSQKALVAQRIETGGELIRGIPNANFSKGYFSGFNFQIRGVGTQLGTAGGDAGVSIHINNVPLTISRFFEADFFDTERVEVLRGPQGTLYGRNATGGVVNVVTAKPVGRFEAAVTGEVASFDSRRVQGMINLPLAGDRLALRVAGTYLNRNGYGTNTYTGNRINDRDLWSTRATLRAEPVEGFDATLMWQHFNESDTRTRTGGEICTKDNGPAAVGGVAVTDPLIRGYLSQGCANASIYGANSNQTPNSLGTLFGYIAQNFGLTNGDYFAGHTVSRDLQDTESVRDPRYRARNNLYTLTLGMQITPTLKFGSITSYMDDTLRSEREFQGAVPDITFNTTPFTPGGFFNDPQIGNFNRYATRDVLTQRSKQYTQELRLDSSFSGRFNFSIGGIYVSYRTVLQDYIFANSFTYFAQFLNSFVFGVPNCPQNNPGCIFIEQNASPAYPNNQGHNYFVSTSPYKLDSFGLFGEAYYKLTDRLKVTVGARYTRDRKQQLVLPVRLLTPGSGQTPNVVPLARITNEKPTGRIAIDWTPDIGFTDHTLIYGVASRGYKAGGLNPPASFTLKPPYAPELVDALEFGVKNTLLDGLMTLNLSGFTYSYKDYQVSEIRNRTQEIQNIDAKVKGLELEAAIEPVRNLRFNMTAGYLDSRITKGAFVDPTNFTGGDPTLTLARGASGATCAVNSAALGAYLATKPPAAAFLSSVCAGLVPGVRPNLDGVATVLRGNKLPNAPDWTVSIGAQYAVEVGDWRATLRGDYYWQDSSFARTYNTIGDRLRSYETVNATLTVENVGAGVQAQLFVKNLFDTQPVTNTFVLDQIVGVPRVGFVTDPRVVGLSLTKRFGR